MTNPDRDVAIVKTVFDRYKTLRDAYDELLPGFEAAKKAYYGANRDENAYRNANENLKAAYQPLLDLSVEANTQKLIGFNDEAIDALPATTEDDDNLGFTEEEKNQLKRARDTLRIIAVNKAFDQLCELGREAKIRLGGGFRQTFDNGKGGVTPQERIAYVKEALNTFGVNVVAVYQKYHAISEQDIKAIGLSSEDEDLLKYRLQEITALAHLRAAHPDYFDIKDDRQAIFLQKMIDVLESYVYYVKADNFKKDWYKYVSIWGAAISLVVAAALEQTDILAFTAVFLAQALWTSVAALHSNIEQRPWFGSTPAFRPGLALFLFTGAVAVHIAAIMELEMSEVGLAATSLSLVSTCIVLLMVTLIEYQRKDTIHYNNTFEHVVGDCGFIFAPSWVGNRHSSLDQMKEQMGPTANTLLTNYGDTSAASAGAINRGVDAATPLLGAR